ncbi:MAG: four helix bundle protein [Bacteroidota bacterium]
MRENILRDKSYSFAISVIKTSEQIIQSKKEYILSKQLIRSGTAIGALIKEAEFAQSKADFINKMSISLKEANETLYWISLLKDTSYITEEASIQLMSVCKELISMLVASIKTVKSKLCFFIFHFSFFIRYEYHNK